MNNNKKETLVIPYLVICSVVIFVIWFFLVWHEQHVKNYSYDSDNLSNIEEFEFVIDEVTYRKDNLPTTKDVIKISGWIVKLNEEIKNCTIHIILKDISNNQCFLLPTEIIDREDITNYLFDEYNQFNYNESGFSVAVPYTKLEGADSHDYEIMALYTLNGIEYLLDSGISVKNGYK